MASVCAAIQKPSLQRVGAKQASAASRAAPRAAVRVMALKQEQKASLKGSEPRKDPAVAHMG